MNKKTLQDYYLGQKKSMQEIATVYGCSVSKISYWMNRYKISKRSISEAVYVKNNPNGDPFDFTKPESKEDATLYGLGLGLYWGEGTKKDNNTVKLGNSDPELIKYFILFLERIFKIKRDKLKFSILIFNDQNPEEILEYWTSKIGARKDQFYKSTVIDLHRKGTYRVKNKYGVLILYFHNKKLRDKLVSLLPT